MPIRIDTMPLITRGYRNGNVTSTQRAEGPRASINQTTDWMPSSMIGHFF